MFAFLQSSISITSGENECVSSMNAQWVLNWSEFFTRSRSNITVWEDTRRTLYLDVTNARVGNINNLQFNVIEGLLLLDSAICPLTPGWDFPHSFQIFSILVGRNVGWTWQFQTPRKVCWCARWKGYYAENWCPCVFEQGLMNSTELGFHLLMIGH